MTTSSANRPGGWILISVLRMASISLVAAALFGAHTTAAAVAYVTNSGDNTVSMIDTITNAVVATIPLGSNPIGTPFGVAITPDGVWTGYWNCQLPLYLRLERHSITFPANGAATQFAKLSVLETR